MKKRLIGLLIVLLVFPMITSAETTSFAIGNTGLSVLVPQSFILDEPENEMLFMAADADDLNYAMVHIDYNHYTFEMLEELALKEDRDEQFLQAQTFLLRALDGDMSCYIGYHSFELLGRDIFCEIDQEYDPDCNGNPVLSLGVSLFLQDTEHSYWVTYVESLIGEDVDTYLSRMQAAEDLISYINASVEDLARQIMIEN